MKRLFKKAAVVLMTIMILFITAFFIYTSIYYKAEDVAVNALNQDIKSGRAKEEKQYIFLPSKTQTDTALILYPYGDIDTQKVLVLYGTMDGVLSREKIKGAADVIPIEGGNHAGFGNYGSQKGDGVALISEKDQQEITTDAILKFITLKEKEKSSK
ncbi:alpha/beta hydrolase [Lacrimispora defluvii]|uniref:Alpha/beta hydrolase fold-5 domain-containing protein n=1 Tax=Lacrimispora defluvii TaxID=2719233 RepID=A0ABX1VUI0_9FIRM|nr:alpha/beta hydrolase [Lacrimispora defluvii]NNJ31695.1 hypothetical protein [Lacrimispora defluvii]